MKNVIIKNINKYCITLSGLLTHFLNCSLIALCASIYLLTLYNPSKIVYILAFILYSKLYIFAQHSNNLCEERQQQKVMATTKTTPKTEWATIVSSSTKASPAVESNRFGFYFVVVLQVFTYKFHGTHNNTENQLMRLSKKIKYWMPEGGVLHPRQLRKSREKETANLKSQRKELN